MINQSTDNWSLRVGTINNVELRMHVLWPLTTLVVLFAVKLADGLVKSKLAEPTVVAWALLIFFTSVALHELARVVTASRVGGRTSELILSPIAGLTKLHLPADPPAHLVTALAGPMTHLVLLVASACALTLRGDPDIFRLLLQPISPELVIRSSVTQFVMVAQLTVWINWCLLLISLLPIDHCAGSELLRGLLWPMVGRSTATSATSRIALGAAVFFALLAVLIPATYSTGKIPAWFPLSVISVFLFYSGCRNYSSRRYDVGLAIDEFDSDDEEWLLSDWDDEGRQAVLVEHLQDKQQEVIDRKRREREAQEDECVDAILLRLCHTSFEQLSEEDRATLKRASRRYRQRQDEHQSED